MLFGGRTRLVIAWLALVLGRRRSILRLRMLLFSVFRRLGGLVFFLGLLTSYDARSGGLSWRHFPLDIGFLHGRLLSLLRSSTEIHIKQAKHL